MNEAAVVDQEGQPGHNLMQSPCDCHVRLFAICDVFQVGEKRRHRLGRDINKLLRLHRIDVSHNVGMTQSFDSLQTVFGHFGRYIASCLFKSVYYQGKFKKK